MTRIFIKRVIEQLNRIKINKVIPKVELPVIKVAILALMIILSPTYAKMIDIQESDFESELKLDVNKNQPLIIKGKEVKITLGESNYNKKIREEREKTKSKNRSVISRDYRLREDVSLEQKRALAKKAAVKFNIDWKILEAVWEVESGKSWDTNKRSYAGATGPMQFMPGTFRNNAVDGNNDGQTDISNAEDALYSAAQLLANSGAASDKIDQALLSYNHAQWYVNKVKKVADSIVE